MMLSLKCETGGLAVQRKGGWGSFTMNVGEDMYIFKLHRSNWLMFLEVLDYLAECKTPTRLKIDFVKLHDTKESAPSEFLWVRGGYGDGGVTLYIGSPGDPLVEVPLCRETIMLENSVGEKMPGLTQMLSTKAVLKELRMILS